MRRPLGFVFFVLCLVLVLSSPFAYGEFDDSQSNDHQQDENQQNNENENENENNEHPHHGQHPHERNHTHREHRNHTHQEHRNHTHQGHRNHTHQEHRNHTHHEPKNHSHPNWEPPAPENTLCAPILTLSKNAQRREPGFSKLQRKRVMVTAISRNNLYGERYGAGYAGYSNQREVIMNLVLVAARMKADILLPPSHMAMIYDPMPPRGEKYRVPWDNIDTTTKRDQFAKFSDLWDLEFFQEKLQEFGISAIESNFTQFECNGHDPEFEHFVLPPFNVFAQEETVHMYQNVSTSDIWENTIKAHLLTTERSEAVQVYHLQLGSTQFLTRDVRQCSDVFNEKQCIDSMVMLQPMKEVVVLADTILSKFYSRFQTTFYSVAHYHDFFCDLKEIMIEWMRDNDLGLVYNVGAPPEGTPGGTMEKYDRGGRVYRPFQINAAIEFEIVMKAPGTFVCNGPASSFDFFASHLRNFAGRETIWLESQSCDADSCKLPGAHCAFIPGPDH